MGHVGRSDYFTARRIGRSSRLLREPLCPVACFLIYCLSVPETGTSKGLMLVAKIFEVIGALAIILFGIILIVLLFFIGKGLKKLNRMIADHRAGITRNLDVSLGGVQEAQVQIDALSVMTSTVRTGLGSALSGADVMVSFLKSSVFQTGLPVLLCIGLIAVTMPRALFGNLKKKKSSTKPIPPPSWELENE